MFDWRVPSWVSMDCTFLDIPALGATEEAFLGRAMSTFIHPNDRSLNNFIGPPVDAEFTHCSSRASISQRHEDT